MDAKDLPRSLAGCEAGKAWPALSLKSAVEQLCAPGRLFELDTVEVRGIPTRVWKNQPPTLAALARHVRAAYAANEFIVYEGDRISYEGWFRAIAALARALQQASVAKGDRVAIAMRNLPEWPVAVVAITSIGAIAVPLNAWWQSEELHHGLADSGASLLICDDQRYQCVAPMLDR